MSSSSKTRLLKIPCHELYKAKKKGSKYLEVVVNMEEESWEETGNEVDGTACGIGNCRPRRKADSRVRTFTRFTTMKREHMILIH